MRLIQGGTEEFGRAFEHFLVEEIRAYLAYEEKFLPLAYWRTSTGLERDLKGLRALMEDQKVREAVLVSQDSIIRKLSGGITVYPWQKFCEKLWAGGFRGLE